MTKRVFFSFHYADVGTFRANVVRNHGVTKEAGTAGFYDASIWEEAERHGSGAVKGLIHEGLDNTSVTCVLIGAETWNRKWVRYEILKSYDRGNAMLGVHINGIADKNGQTLPNGPNVFEYLGFLVSSDGKLQTYYEWDGAKWVVYAELAPKAMNYAREHWGQWFRLSTWVPIYDWVQGDGYRNFGSWVASAK